MTRIPATREEILRAAYKPRQERGGKDSSRMSWSWMPRECHACGRRVVVTNGFWSLRGGPGGTAYASHNDCPKPTKEAQ